MKTPAAKHTPFTILRFDVANTPWRPHFFLIGLIVGMLCSLTLHAEIWKFSPMNGFATGNLGIVGSSEGWAGDSDNYAVTNGSGSLIGANLGLVPSTGDKAEVNADTGDTNTRNVFANSGQFPANTSTNIYYSFLLRFNDAGDVDIAGEQVAQVNLQNSGSTYYYELLARNSGGQIQLGINKPSGTAVYATTNIAIGQTVFVVVRQQMISGASTDDIIDLWINPSTNLFGVDEGSIPPVSVSSSNGSEPTSNTGPGRFYLRSGANFTFDELRITSTWAEATPNVCYPASITLDPVDAAVVAGINASFSATADGTSLLYEWQASTNSGTTWNNVGFSPIYFTPNLALADNGTQYRCIASSCDGSSATSAVATITVTAPVETPVGLVVDDDWSDLDRTTGPVTTNNSVWFASNGGSLIFSGDSLFGMPASLSSRLWIGYFTDDTVTNLPVHLGIGKTMKVTWEWNSDQIVASGGNLRVGVFDYADGGIRVTGDGFGSGSTGNGNGVRGYMLTMDYAQMFTDTTPFEFRPRTVLDSVNLMGTTGNYPISLGSGPLVPNGAPAFQSLTNYTLELSVTRTAENEVDITASITGGGTNWTLNVTDNQSAYHRFDAFAIRPNSLETTSLDFLFVNFKVEVLQGVPDSIPLNITRSGNDVILSWSNPVFDLQAAPTVTGTFTNIVGATSPYTNSTAGSEKYFRLIAN